MKKVSSTIHDLFLEKRTILFCGAGVSYNSGIPTVFPLTTFILESLNAEEQHIKTYIQTAFPFEATIENMNQRLSIDSLLQVFNVENPTMGHKYIAWLAYNNLLRIIITTNFDENIELELKSMGWISGKDFDVITELENFNIAAYGDKTLIIKLHGSITKPELLLTTITRVANKQNYTLIKEVLSKIFKLNEFDKILFWGYSFSDHFDITPALKDINNSSKIFYVIEHNLDKNSEKIYSTKNNYLNNQSETICLKCNSDEILKELSVVLNIPDNEVKVIDWTTKVSDWIRNTFDGKGLHNNYAMLSYLFSESGHLKIGIHYAEIGLKKIDPSDLFLKMDLLNKIGHCLVANFNTRDSKKAAPYHEEAIKIAKSINHDVSESIYSANLANCYLDLGDYYKAETLYYKAININKKHLQNAFSKEKTLKDICGYEVMLSICLRKQGKINEAELLLKSTLAIVEAEGIMTIQDICLSSLGKIYFEKGDFGLHIEYHLRAYAIAKKMAFIHRLDSLFFIICSNIKKSFGIKEAQKFYLKEIDYLKATTGLIISFEEIPYLI